MGHSWDSTWSVQADHHTTAWKSIKTIDRNKKLSLVKKTLTLYQITPKSTVCYLKTTENE